MSLAQYRTADGSYQDASGCSHEDAVDFLLSGVMGFCGCGKPEKALEFIRDALQHIKNLDCGGGDNESFKSKSDAWIEAGKAIFPNEGAEYFTYYVLDVHEMIERGGSVPGWLTAKGEAFLEDATEALKEAEQEREE